MSNTYDNEQLQKQIASANCGGYLGGYLPASTFTQPVLFDPRKLTIEAVDGGYVVTGHLQGKGGWRPVATSSHQLARLLKQWSAQFEPKAE